MIKVEVETVTTNTETIKVRWDEKTICGRRGEACVDCPFCKLEYLETFSSMCFGTEKNATYVCWINDRPCSMLGKHCYFSKKEIECEHLPRNPNPRLSYPKEEKDFAVRNLIARLHRLSPDLKIDSVVIKFQEGQ